MPEAGKAAGRESGSGRSDGGSGVDRVPAGTNGLVICAKSVRDTVDGIVDAELSASDALGLRFPRPNMVASAAALFEPAEPWAHGRDRLDVEPECGRFRITIGPGVVRLGWTNPVRAEKASERTVGQHMQDVAGEVDRIKAGRDVPDPSGRAITEWSRKSRAAMCRTFAELDYTPMVESGRVPAMVTLTYPGDWESVAPDGASVKRHMMLWRKRFQREWGEPARYIWKMEFQRRGAPHIHLWMAPRIPSVDQAVGSANGCRRNGRKSSPIPTLNNAHATCAPVRLSTASTDCVLATPNAWRSTSRSTHHRIDWATRNTSTSFRRPGGGRAADRVALGVHGLERATAVVEIAQDAYLTARRIIRRWSRSQAIHSDCTHCFPTALVPRMTRVAVQRTNSKTGKVRHRNVCRRRLLCRQGGFAGGYALVNDGPAFASQLAAALSADRAKAVRDEQLAGRK